MARPLKVGLSYFPHDTDASSDPKLEPLLMIHGLVGYGFYFLLLEYIYRSDNFQYNISDAETKQILCRKMSITEQDFEKYLDACFKYRCFDKELFNKTGCISSNGVRKRADVVVKKRIKMKKEYNNGKKGNESV
jgi:hypothetical protein